MIKENLIELYAHSFRDNWDRPALTEYTGRENLTYGQLAERIAMTHDLFRKLGIKAGSKVAVCGRDSANWVVSYMSVITYGAVVVPILSGFNAVDIVHILNHCEAELLFVSDPIWEHIEFEHAHKLRGVISLDTRKVLDERGDDSLARMMDELKDTFAVRHPQGYTAADIDFPSVPNDAIMELNYTSGTTGFSKGVMLTGNNLAGNVVFGLSQKLHLPGSHVLSFLPLAHAYGCAFDMLTALAAGSHVFILGKLPSPKILVKAMQDVKPHLILSVPLVMEKIYRNLIVPMISKLSVRWTLSVPLLDKVVYGTIRRKLVEAFGGEFVEIILGGAPLNAEVEEFLYKIKFPFTVGYGMTECGPLISYTPWRDFVPGSSGRTLEGLMESKILSPDPENIPGEICVRGENVMKGYYKNQEATEAVLDSDGWLHTGDMGTRSADGTIFIRGRSKTMILTADGQNIYPEEIESKLNNMPYVAESLIVEREGKLVALVYPDYDALDTTGIPSTQYAELMEQTRTELNKMLARYEQVSRIVLIPNEFEKTPKKTIKRFLYTN